MACYRTRDNGHKLKQRKFQQNPRKNFFLLRVTELWPRLPREAVESPSLEIFQPRLDKVLYSLLWVTLLGQGVGLGDPQKALPTPAMLGLWDSVTADFSKCAGPSQCRAKLRPCGKRLWDENGLVELKSGFLSGSSCQFCRVITQNDFVGVGQLAVPC